MHEFPNIKSRKRKVRILQEEKMETFIKNEEKRKLNSKLRNSEDEDEDERVEIEEGKSNLKNNNVDITIHKKTRKLKRQERKQETDYFDLKDEIHVRNYLKTESEKNEKNEKNDKSEQNLKSNFRRKILETDVNNDLNNKINKNNKSIEFEIEEENKIEDSGMHLSEGYVYVYIASDNEVVKEAFAEFLKEFHSHIRGEKLLKGKS